MSRWAEEPSAYGFNCENEDCLAIMVVYPHCDSPGIPDPFERYVLADDPHWEQRSPDCPACGEPMDLTSGDPVTDIIRTPRRYWS